MIDEEPDEVESCPHCGSSIVSGEAVCAICGKRLQEEPSAGGTEVAYRDLVTIFRGRPTEVLSLAAVLQAKGLEPFVPDATSKVIDPFITGGGTALFYELMVPADRTLLARDALVEVLGRDRAIREGLLDAPDGAGDADPGERRRAIWLAMGIVLVFGAILLIALLLES